MFIEQLDKKHSQVIKIGIDKGRNEKMQEKSESGADECQWIIIVANSCEISRYP